MMIVKKKSKMRLRGVVFGIFLAMMATLGSLGGTLMLGESVYADPAENTTTTTTTENTTGDNTGNNAGATTGTNTGTAVSTGDDCKNSLGAIGWLVCPTTGAIAQGVDFLYGLIKDFLVIDPVVQQDGSPIYEIWKYCRGFANIVFIIFLLVVIYSQITGVGISNYGIKKALPKLIVVAVLMNLSFLICSLAVDVSNILGESVRGLFDSVASSAVPANSGMNSQEMAVANAEMYSAMAGGTALTIGGAVIAFETGTIWMLIPLLLGAIVAVVTGLITIALRQAVVALLIMIAPLAVVAYMLPNTENLFTKWRKLLTQMLVFYPAFSLLFGASSLAGFAIIMSAQNGFGLLLGVAVQIFPLFFSWKLMQMSGTFLGTINSKMRELGSKPVAGARTWAGTRKAHTNAKYLQYGTTPFSHLRRYMDNKRELEEQHTASIQQLRKYDANIYAQKVIGAGYDGTKAQGTKGNLTPNKYTKVAKDLSNTKLASETVTMDTAHVLGNYSDYFVDEKIRERVTKAREAKDEAALEALRRTDAEYRRADIGAKNFLEYSRAEMTAENDSESDFKFMVSSYLDAFEGYDPNDKSDIFSKYRHYITSSAGGLGDAGQTRVLGKIIARAAAVESNQRRDVQILANKYPHAKREFRNMVVGYCVDDNGYATDREGNVLPGEKYRGYLLQYHPEQLVLWDRIDEQGRKYYDWYDGDRFVTRIFETDRSAIKELLSNFDAPICDPINNLYGILAGVTPGKDGVPEHVGLNSFRTTIGRSLSSFKEKNAAFSPMVSEMIKKGYIKNYAQEYLAYLDSLNKATKPGAFNTQDADAIGMFADLMNPDKWPSLFPEELIRGYQNVNGEPISGYEVDADGNIIRNDKGKPIKVSGREPTYDELMACVKEKFIFPAAHKMTMMMARQTPNTADNQKVGTVEKWKELVEVFNKKWGKDSPLGVDPYEQKGDMLKISRGVRNNLYTNDSMTGYLSEVDNMYINSQNDGESFAQELMDLCMANKEKAGFDSILQNFLDYCDAERAAGRYLDCDSLKEEFESLIMQFCSD
ncbi:MAG: type IV secretion system protein [Candidatus Saccharibacteria bacterium]|nr:type IV secretion system protein [Candidatus Saccharibacteria bacterium]